MKTNTSPTSRGKIMDWRMKKVGPALSATLIAITSLLNASGPTNSGPNTAKNLYGENKVDRSTCNQATPCPAPVCCIDEQGVGNNPANAPSARQRVNNPCCGNPCNPCPPIKNPCVPCGADNFCDGSNAYAEGYANGFLVDAELLVWTTHQDGLDFVVANQNTPTLGAGSYSSNYTNANQIELRNKWSAGFRIGAGWDMAHDQWDLYASWTWYRNHVTRDVDQECDGCGSGGTAENTLFATRSAVNPGETGTGSLRPLEVTDADGSWKLHLNMVDLELGRKFFAGQWLILRPHAGLRGAWLKQNFNINYSTNTTLNPTLPSSPSTTHTLNVRDTNKYWGIGPRVGMDSQWNVGSGFSLYGDTALSILYGRFRIQENETLDSGANLTGTPNANVILQMRDRFTTAKAIADLDLGVRYEVGYGRSCSRFVVSLGWETHVFFNQNQFRRFWTDGSDTSSPGSNQSTLFSEDDGDLTTQGVTLALRFEF